jgi:mannobiose 2-epimerase
MQAIDFQNIITQNILPFWIEKMQDNENGGFFGQIDGENRLHPHSNKGAVLNCRILWTFSAACRVLKNDDYLQVAQRAYDYIEKYFIDKEYGGVFWELDYQGKPINTKKQTYAQGFALYGFSEFYRATGNPQALERAKEFFYLIEKNCKDKSVQSVSFTCCGGYFEAFTRDWQPIEDVRLSDKDKNEVKTMNTHLHILEPYTNLLRSWKNEDLIAAQKELLEIFTEIILNKTTSHLNLFFDENWTLKSSAQSFGHDIEAAWLLYEAAEVLGDKDILEKVKNISIEIADAAAEGLQTDGSMIYERHWGHDPQSSEKVTLDADKHWWVQAESVVGFMYACKNSGNEIYRQRAEKAYIYIVENMIDNENGEWYWSRKSDGKINTSDDKAGFWKCPYHNSRMCLEMMFILQTK